MLEPAGPMDPPGRCENRAQFVRVRDGKEHLPCVLCEAIGLSSAPVRRIEMIAGSTKGCSLCGLRGDVGIFREPPTDPLEGNLTRRVPYVRPGYRPTG